MNTSLPQTPPPSSTFTSPQSLKSLQIFKETKAKIFAIEPQITNILNPHQVVTRMFPLKLKNFMNLS
jgi:hypothetical protein